MQHSEHINHTPMPPVAELVLASRSPQRRAILAQLGIPFRTVPSTHTEVVVPHDPVATAESNAAGKAAEVVRRGAAARNDLVLAVDTIVVVDEAILGKAADEDEARAYVRLLAGRSHDVVSGLCLRRGDRERVGHCVTTVTFRPLTGATIDRYMATGEWRERAGAYAIQGFGSALVGAVHGDYFNVVGLPLGLLVDALEEFGQPSFAWGGPVA
jgi:septum formation protein